MYHYIYGVFRLCIVLLAAMDDREKEDIFVCYSAIIMDEKHLALYRDEGWGQHYEKVGISMKSHQ